MNRKYVIILIVLALLLLPIIIYVLFLLAGVNPISDEFQTDIKAASQPVTLNYWRVWDGPDAMNEIIADYNAVHPHIKIKYRKLRYEEYEQALLEGFATDSGPDIFSIHNTWMTKYQNKSFITSLPAQTQSVFTFVKSGGIKQETTTELRTNKMPTLKDLENKFVDVVYGDVVIKALDEKTKVEKEQIFGLPLALDTMALFYNKDLLNNAGITEPPEYWNRKFQQDVKKLTKQDTRGQIIQAGAALGGSSNIDRASDILAVLMMQNGATMMSAAGRVMFQAIPENFENKNYNPGLEALRFYTDFANPGKEVYTWNSNADNSIDMFANGKVALMFGYSYHIPLIKAKNPKLNYNISKLPQIEGNERSVNMANYWVEVVSKKTKNSNEAWDFLNFAAVKEDEVKKYLAVTQKPTALKSLVNEQIEDPEVGIFAEAVLTAKSWYQGNNPIAAEKAINEMIDLAQTRQDDLVGVIGYGANRVQQTVGE